MNALRRRFLPGETSLTGEAPAGVRLACRCLAWLGLAAAFFMTSWFLRGHVDLLLDSDEASELLLGKLLAEKGGVLSRDWYYSTELRVLSSNLLTAPLFRLTDSWHTVRVWMLRISCVWMLLSYLLYGKSVEGRRYFVVFGVMLMLPFSYDYYAYALKGGYYFFHIAVIFLTLALGEVFLREKRRLRRVTALAAGTVLAVLTGMGGPRLLLLLYLPLLAAALADLPGRFRHSDRSWLLYTAAGCFGCGFGYALNRLVLAKRYAFYLWDEFSLSAPDLDRLRTLLRDFVGGFGYRDGAPLSNMLSLLWLGLTVCAILHALRHREAAGGSPRRLALCMLFAFGFFAAVYTFTDLYYISRYNLTIVVLSIPLLAWFFALSDRKKAAAQLLILVLVGGFSFLGVRFYQAEGEKNATGPLRKVGQFLVDHAYTQGYSTFWNGNVLTELTNGEIEVWCWTADAEKFPEVETPDDLYLWLQVKRHSTSVPEGKLFMILTLPEFELCSWGERLREEDVVYRIGQYTVFGYDSHDEMLAILCPDRPA